MSTSSFLVQGTTPGHVELIATVKAIRALTKDDISLLSEEQRFCARVYLRMWLSRLNRLPVTLADETGWDASVPSISSQLEALA